MWKKVLIVVGVLLVLAVGVLAFLFMRGPDLSAYERFREPAVVTMTAQKMLVVEAIGAPEKSSGAALKSLFDLYFKLDGVEKGFQMPAPRARWPKPLDTPAEQWVGQFALAVPDALTSLPAQPPGEAPARLETWEYGEVAQILHVGPYTLETPTIERLHAFIRANGYAIAGPHEEEYLRGPGMMGKGDPDRYYTLIRYRVKK